MVLETLSWCAKRKLPSFDSCQKVLLWAHKEVDLALHSVIVLVLQLGDAKKFPQAHQSACTEKYQNRTSWEAIITEGEVRK